MNDGTYYTDANGHLTHSQIAYGYWVGVHSLGVYNFAPTEAMLKPHGVHATVGVWTNLDDGKVYVDRVKWFADLDTALSTARECGELAIWDIANNSEIRVDYAPVIV